MSMLHSSFSSSEISPWWPEFTSELSNLKWAELQIIYGITRKSYSATEIILGEHYEPKLLVDIFRSDESRSIDGPRIEVLHQAAEPVFANHGLKCRDFARCGDRSSVQILKAAFGLIGAIPSLLTTVMTLGRSVILLEADDDASDVSYSSPDVPFSIFISLPSSFDPDCHARVAEAIIHECMHLQLTLLEEWSPLIEGRTETRFSPWKGEFRNSSGIMHGLYVFTVVKKWLQKSQIRDSRYVNRRIDQIVDDANQILDFSHSLDLTPFGRAICNRLFNQLLLDAAI
jgi:HEXXH motif-containing protein